MDTVEKLHRYSDDDLREKWVSPYSLWHAKGWRFDDMTAGAHQKFIRWDRPLPDGSNLFDDEWSRLLDASKRLLWSLLTEPADGVALKIGSIDKWQTAFWCLVEWMSVNDYRDWSEIDSLATDEYIDYFKLEKIPGQDGKDKSAQSVSSYLQILVRMWEQTDIIRAAGASTLPEAPFRGKNAFETAKEISEISESEIPTVEDNVFITSMNEISQWLDYKGEDIIRALEMALDLKSQYVVWARKSANSDVVRDEIVDFKFSDDPSTGQPWHGPLASCSNPGAVIRGLVADLNMAGIITLQAAMGMRISEVCGLEADPDHAGPFPSCVELESSSSGLFDVFYVKGKLFKTTSEWIEVRWVAGLRPKGTDYLPPPIKAIVLVERLFRRWRIEGKHTALFLTMGSKRGLPNSADNVWPQSNDPVDQHGWILKHTDARPSVRVTSHQWRKAFAKWIFRTDKRLLPAIALHFKHVSLAMTEKYIGNDLELIENVDSEASRRAAEVLYDMATGRSNLRGPTAKMLRDRALELARRLGNRSEADQRLDMTAAVEENGIRVWSLSHGGKPYGACIFRPGIAVCRKAQIGPLIRPDMAVANPGACAGCTSFAAEDEHVPFWRERYRKNRTLYLDNRDGDIGVAMLAKTRMEQCSTVLGWLGIDPEQDPEKETADAA